MNRFNSNQGEQTQTEMEQLQSHLQRIQIELDQLQSRLQHTQIGIESLHSQLPSTHTEDQAELNLKQINLGVRNLRTTSLEKAEVTDILYSRLNANDIAEIEERLNIEDAASWVKTPADSVDRKHLALHFGVYYKIPRVLDKTGLSSATPPDDVHSMARGSLAAGGSFYYADLVMGAMRRIGAKLKLDSNVLDFGCSSGRILRVLSVAYPNIKWYGCDPNEAATSWARENLKNIGFLASPQEPPLAYSSGMFDLVYAISIWSHFGQLAALKWFEEMRRIIRPGGYLLFTTHGYQSLAYYLNSGLHSTETLDVIVDSLYREGFYFMNRFGEAGDWGVVHSEWGEAFISPEWWLEKLCPTWHVSLFIPGFCEGNQDLIVLEAK